MNSLFFLTDLRVIYIVIIRLFCVGLVISSLEYLFTLRNYSSSGIFSWKVLRLKPGVLNSKFYNDSFDIFFEKAGFGTLVVFRLLSGLSLLVYPITSFSIFFLVIIVFTSLLISFRNIVGDDGSDQMNLLICLTLLITFLGKDTGVARLGLYFICLQAILSYTIAGIAKLISRKWNRGLAIYEITNTHTYGNEMIAGWLKRLPPVYTKILNWNIIVFECLYFLVIFLPYPFFLISLFWGFLFHLYNAVSMGLNGFFWAFLACYPSIIYVNAHFHLS